MSVQANEPINSPTRNCTCSDRSWTITSLFKSACKVASVATGIMLDVADGFIRGTSLTMAGLCLLLTLMIPGSGIGALSVFLIAISVFFLSKKVLSDAIAPYFYQFGDVRSNHPLRWIPFLAGVQVSLMSIKGPFAAFS